MSALCPQCGQTLEQDFGVVSCPKCQSVLVIDLDGNIQIQDAGAIAEEIHDAIQEPEIEQVAEMVEEPFNEPVVEESFMEEIIPDNASVSTPLINTSSSIISYQVRIEGIDTKEIRAQLEEALRDPKFPWSAREIIQETNDGVLQLASLNPVTASVLVRRLKDLPLTISWKQNIYESV